jgi:hypothetical protein
VPSSSFGTSLDSESLRIAVALRIGAPICQPHICRCGAQVMADGHHALSCRLSAGRFPRHAEINTILKRTLGAAGLPALLEPVGVDRGDGKRPDGMTTFPFKQGKCMVWDVTVVDTFAASNINLSAVEAGAAAVAAEDKKKNKYRDLVERFQFEPVAFETIGSCGAGTERIIREIGGRASEASGDTREISWLWQRISLAIVRGNSLSVQATSRQHTRDIFIT